MSQRDGFTSGFLAGVVVGGLVGGLIGALVAGQRDTEDEAERSLIQAKRAEAKAMKGRKSQLTSEESIEVARRSLEDKIAQLNTAIDDVRQQLGTVNGNAERQDAERLPEP
jgi:gas vesicle protein